MLARVVYGALPVDSIDVIAIQKISSLRLIDSMLERRPAVLEQPQSLYTALPHTKLRRLLLIETGGR